MQQFTVDDELAALVEKVAKPKPFENLSFNAALWRVFREYVLPSMEDQGTAPPGDLVKKSMVATASVLKKAPTPSVENWIGSVPELKDRKGLTTWKAVCTFLKIETAGDSARRKLKNWVKTNRPNWPPVPEID